MYTKIYSRYTTETCTLNYTSAVVVVAASVRAAAAAATVLKQRFYDLLNGRKER
jgi:hypothetical protein